MSTNVSATPEGEAGVISRGCAVVAGAHDPMQRNEGAEATRAIIDASTSMKMGPIVRPPPSPPLDTSISPSPVSQLESYDAVVSKGRVVQTVNSAGAHDTPSSSVSTLEASADGKELRDHDTVTPLLSAQSSNTNTPAIQYPLPTDTQQNRSLFFPRVQSEGLSPHTISPPIGAVDTHTAPKDVKMVFGLKSPASTIQRRRNYANTNAVTDYEADLTSKDRTKQKDAVRKYLMETVKDDWQWEWPIPQSEALPKGTETVEDNGLTEGPWKERDEWLSNASESDDQKQPTRPAAESSHDTPTPGSKNGASVPFRFDTPDGVGDSIIKTQQERKRRRKKRLAEEAAWNPGLACFNARRDAWTGARKVSRPLKPSSPITSSKRASQSSGDGGSSTALEQEDLSPWEDDTEIPIAPPILPPENAMRASILPAAYNTIYDKVIVQALTPSCPMNLKDVTRSCVQGWKRDGEWPPKSSAPDPAKKKSRKMSVASLLGFKDQERASAAKTADDLRERERERVQERKGSTASHGGGSIRKSLQKILHLGHHNGADSGHENR